MKFNEWCFDLSLFLGCMLCLGRSNYFRFNHPKEAKKIKEAMPNCRISCAPLAFLQGNYYHPSLTFYFVNSYYNEFLAHKIREEYMVYHCLSVLLSFLLFFYFFRTDFKFMIQNYRSRLTFLTFYQGCWRKLAIFLYFGNELIKSTTLNKFW